MKAQDPNGLKRAAFERCYAQRDETGHFPREAVEELIDTWRLIPLIQYRVALDEAGDALPWIEAEVERRTAVLRSELLAAKRDATRGWAAAAVHEFPVAA